MKVPQIAIKIGADVSKLRKDMRKADGIVSKFSSAASFGMNALAASAGAFAFKLGVDGVKAASDLGETMSKTNVIFGKTADELQTWAETNANMMGQTQQQALDAAATFATFGKAAGLENNKLLNFSEKLTVLSSDLASFYNTDPQDAIQAIGAALRGESEPIRRYGVLLNDAALKQEALTMGLYSGKGALSSQAKVMASYKLIMNQTKDAQGDFARTSDGLANGQRILEAQLHDATLEIGEALLPAIQEVTGYLNSPEGKKAIAQFASTFADGAKVLAENLPKVADKVGDIVDNLDDLGIGDIFDNPQYIAAAVAFAKFPGPWQTKLLAAAAAYAGVDVATGNAGNAFNKAAMDSLGGRGAVALSEQGQARAAALSNQLKANVANPYAMKGTRAPVFSSLYGQQPVTININGAIDPAATARLVQKYINQGPRNNVSPDISKRSK